MLNWRNSATAMSSATAAPAMGARRSALPGAARPPAGWATAATSAGETAGGGARDVAGNRRVQRREPVAARDPALARVAQHAQERRAEHGVGREHAPPLEHLRGHGLGIRLDEALRDPVEAIRQHP